MDRIGVRELRQHASRFLARVEAGEVIEITARGKPVARLVPLSPDPWSELLNSGAVRVPEHDGDLLDLAAQDYGIDASGELARLREKER